MRKLIKKLHTIYILLSMMLCFSGLHNVSLHAATASQEVTKIIFGLFGDFNAKKDNARVEVTDQLQKLLKKGKISKGGGFKKISKTDPAKGEHKGLFVMYTKGNQLFCSIHDEKEKLEIPAKDDMQILRGKAGLKDLQILKALYGDLNQPEGKKTFIDVSSKVKGLVRDQALQLSGKKGSYNDLFSDPAKGIKKALLIVYRVADKMFVKVFQEDQKGSITFGDTPGSYQVYTFALKPDFEKREVVVIPASRAEMTQSVDAALNKFSDGTKVILMSYADAERPRLLQVGKGGHLVPTGIEPTDVSTHFIIHRIGNFITLTSAVTGDFIKVFPILQMIRLEKGGSPEWAEWSVEFDEPDNPYSFVYLKSKASGGYLSAPVGKWTSGRMWTTIKERLHVKGARLSPVEPAPKNTTARFKIFIADELIHQVEKKKSLPEKAIEKVVDIVREIEPLNVIAGGTEFTYSPILHLMKPKYDNKWKLSTPGSGSVVFDASGKNRMVITFSSVPKNLDNGMYYISIGHKKNTRSGIRKKDNGAMLFEVDATVAANKDASITGGLPENGTRFDSYWASVNHGVVTVGKGRVVGEHEFMRWVDPNPADLVSFVGFGGGKLNSIHYKNIVFDSVKTTAITATQPSQEIVLPDQFNAEGIKADEIAVGMRNGKPQLFAVINHELYYRAQGANAKTGWTKITSSAFDRVRRVSVSPRDGFVYIVTMDGKVLKYNWKNGIAKPAQKVIKKKTAKKKKASKKKTATSKKAKKATKKKKSQRSTSKKSAKKSAKKKSKRAAGKKKKSARKKALKKTASSSQTV